MILIKNKIAIIGLGYVGLPLAIEFGKKYQVLGFDINKDRILQLSQGKDYTNEADLDSLFYVMDQSAADQGKGIIFYYHCTNTN
jgi:UDP-N-acetyl-D-galactosamine dehydrogenase